MGSNNTPIESFNKPPKPYSELSPMEKVNVDIRTTEEALSNFFSERKKNGGTLSATDKEIIDSLREKLNNLNELEKKYIETEALKDGFEIEKKTATSEAKNLEQLTDRLILDPNETKAWELIKKTGILKHLPAFEAKLAAGDKDAKTDALQLEKALAADGKSLTVDGIITQKTIDAARALIGENAEVILKYEETLKLVSAPNSTPSTPPNTPTGKTPG